MAKLDQATSQNGSGTHFTNTVVLEKNERIARKSLHDLIVFHESLDVELQQMTNNALQGLAIDRALFDKMTLLQEKYQEVMNGFLILDDDKQRHVMIVFADAVQDLMAYIHSRKEN